MKSILKIETLCALLLIGASPHNGLTEVINDIHKFSDEINKNANNITDENKFIDVTYARELIGILKRRISISNELFSLNLNNIPEYDLFKNTQTEAMPKNTRWIEIETEAKNNKAINNYPLTKLILDKFDDSLLYITKKEFKDLKLDENIDKSVNEIGSVIPLAQTLADLIEKIKIEKIFYVEQMLHHSLATEVREANGGIIAPAAVSLNSFLPDSTKAEKNLEKNAQAPGLNNIDFTKAFIGYFNLLDYLGFAVDISLVNTDQQRLNQEDIIEEIKKQISNDIYSQNVVIILKPMSVTCSRRTDKSVGYSFVKIAIIPKDLLAAFIDNTPIKDDKVEKFKIEKWLDFRGVKVNTTTEIKKKDLEILNKITSYVLALINEDILNEIELQPADNRWFTLPTIAGKSETSWQVPDEYGHRYKVAARLISRYEPLLLWKNNVIFANVTTESIGQEDWLKAEVKPIYPGGKESFTSIIPIYNIPNEQVVKFLYTLPLDIVLSLKNQIPSIRSGYKGISIEFHYELIDRPEARAYKTIINSIKKLDLGLSKQPSFKGEPIEFVSLQEEDVNLDSYQRIIQLGDLPYYNRYFIRPTANYENESGLAAKQPATSPLVAATIEPSIKGFYEPKIENHEVPTGQTHVDYEFTIFLSKNCDFVTESSLKTPADIDLVHNDGTIFPSSMLPDLLTDYIIYWKLDNYYIQFACLRLPWSEHHSSKVIENFNESLPVIKELYPSLTIVTPGNDQNVQGKVIEANVEIHYYKAPASTPNKSLPKLTEVYWYYVTFKIRVPFEINVFRPGRGRFYLRAVRKGVQSQAFEFDTSGVIDPTLAVPPDIILDEPDEE